MRMRGMRRMRAPATMQAMPSSCLLMLTVISFPPGLRLMRLRQFCSSGSLARLWRRGMELGRDTGFSSGLTVLLHLRSKPGGFCCSLPEGIGSPGAGLSQTKPVGKSSESRFKAVSTAGVSSLCCGCHEGICERCWRLSEAFQREVRGLVPAHRCWGGGLWTARSLFTMGPRNRGRKRLSRVELLPEPGSESRFRISPEPGGSGLEGRDLLPPRPSGWSTGFSLLSFQP